MKIVMLVLGVMAAQVAVALCIARWIRAGKWTRIVAAYKGHSEPPHNASEVGPAPAAIDNYADLAALLIALAPQPEKAAAREEREEAAPSAIRLPNQLGPWPGASTR
jgi:hypothetical protein